MTSRARTLALLLGSLFALAATSADGRSGDRQWALTYLDQPTIIGTTIVQGPVMFVHDAARMRRGEPCTSVRLFDPGRGPAEQIASFHCVPTPREVVHRFTVTTRPNAELGFGCVLTEFQFAGDHEGHGVPFVMNAH